MSIYNLYFSNFGRPPVPDHLCKDSAPKHPRFWRKRFLKVFTTYGHGGHLGQWTTTILAIFRSAKDNSKSKESRVVILVRNTSSCPILQFYKVPSNYSEGYSSYRADMKSISNKTKGENSKSKHEDHDGPILLT